MKNIFFLFLLLVFTSAKAQMGKFDVNGDLDVNTGDVVAIYDYIMYRAIPKPANYENEDFRIDDIKFTMIAVRGGSFKMGATSEQTNAYEDETPVHKVNVNTFCIGQTEVTQALWKAVMGTKPSHFFGDDLPVENVSWNDCQVFLTKLNTYLSGQLRGRVFRLPTEIEWEYAARGGEHSKGYKYSGSNNLDDVAWYSANSTNSTHPVASKTPNELGLYDMSGNVCEWCQDWYASDWYKRVQRADNDDPTAPTSGSFRVIRCGCWNNDETCCRTSFRGGDAPASADSGLGLRLVLSDK